MAMFQFSLFSGKRAKPRQQPQKGLKPVWNHSETPSGSPSQTLCSFGYSIIALFCFSVARKMCYFLCFGFLAGPFRRAVAMFKLSLFSYYSYYSYYSEATRDAGPYDHYPRKALWLEPGPTREGSPCKPLSDSFQSHFRHISDSFQIHFRAIYRQYFGWIQCPSSSWNPTSALTIPEGIRTLLPECRICFFFGNHPHIAALCFADCESWAEKGQQCRRCQAESR